MIDRYLQDRGPATIAAPVQALDGDDGHGAVALCTGFLTQERGELIDHFLSRLP
jgi:hypothetical protein